MKSQIWSIKGIITILIITQSSYLLCIEIKAFMSGFLGTHKCSGAINVKSLIFLKLGMNFTVLNFNLAQIEK